MASDEKREGPKTRKGDGAGSHEDPGGRVKGGELEASPLYDVVETKRTFGEHYHFLLEFCHTHPGSHEPKPAHWRKNVELSPMGREMGHEVPERFLEFLASREGFGIKKGLENVRALLDRLDLSKPTAPVILVAGTNGKGTVATAVAEALATVGYRPGLYTSPHVERFLERIQVMGGDPDDEVLVGACDRVIEAVRALDEKGLHATYFEVATALALEVFRRHDASPWVLEVGMGGRLDAVNALDPMLSLVTTVGTDHVEHLGAQLAQRAREKAGIMRPGVPCFTAAQGEAFDALADHAAGIGAPLVGVMPGDRADPDASIRSLVRAALSDPLVVKRLPKLEKWAPSSLVLPRLPARRESWRFPGGAHVLLDVAHNEEAFDVMASHVQGLPFPLGKRVLLAGLLGDKDPEALARLAKRFDRVVLTRPPSPRAWEVLELQKVLVAAGVDEGRVDTKAVPLEGLEEALRSTPGDGLLVVAGSFYLAGEVRPALREVAVRA